MTTPGVHENVAVLFLPACVLGFAGRCGGVADRSRVAGRARCRSGRAHETQANAEWQAYLAPVAATVGVRRGDDMLAARRQFEQAPASPR